MTVRDARRRRRTSFVVLIMYPDLINLLNDMSLVLMQMYNEPSSYVYINVIHVIFQYNYLCSSKEIKQIPSKLHEADDHSVCGVCIEIMYNIIIQHVPFSAKNKFFLVIFVSYHYVRVWLFEHKILVMCDSEWHYFASMAVTQ